MELCPICIMVAQRSLYLLQVGHALPVEQLAMTGNSARNAVPRNLSLLLPGNALSAEKKVMMESSARNVVLRSQRMDFGHALLVEQPAMTGNSARIAERKEGNRHGEQE